MAAWEMEFMRLTTDARSGKAVLQLTFDSSAFGEVGQFAQTLQRFAVAPLHGEATLEVGPAATEAIPPQAVGGAGEVEPPPRASAHPKRARTPAEMFYLTDCHDSAFMTWLDCDTPEGAKEALKLLIGLSSLSAITQAQVNAVRAYVAKGGGMAGLKGHMTKKGLYGEVKP